jgi:hypothetical protein
MAGGIVQLVAYGVQDLFLSDNPQITFFKTVYRRHTNFSTEVIPQNFTHTPDFGRRVTAILGRNGDLIRNIHLVIELPRIPSFKDANGDLDVISKFMWAKRIGYVLIKKIEIEIGNELIDKQYGDWMNIWHELIVKYDKNIDKMIGDIKIITEPTNGKETYKLFIPLQFWFCRITGLALPIVSLQYNHIKINLEINDFDKSCMIAPTHFINIDNDFVNFESFEYISQNVNGLVSLARFVHFDIINRRLYLWRLSDNGFHSLIETDPNNIQTEAEQDSLLYSTLPNDHPTDPGGLVNSRFLITGMSSGFQAIPRINAAERTHKNTSINFKTIKLKNAFLLVEYIYLDDQERINFSQSKHEYLIEQIFFDGEKTIDGLHQSFKLGFTQPCKELIWVSQLSLVQNKRINDHFNYTDSLIRKIVNSSNGPDTFGNLIGSNIIRKETLLFNSKERVSLRDSSYFNWIQPYQHHTVGPCEGVNVYSFALHPAKHQPSCTANFSKIDNLSLRVSVLPEIDFTNTAKLRVYAVVYNLLRVSNGISGLVFANDLS